jgi:nitrogen fixation NifU-like protein
MDHFMAPRNCGAMDSPDTVGHSGTPGQGPFLILYVKVADGVVVAARFQTYACGSTIACGSMLTEMICQRSIDQCLALTPEDVIDALDGVPAHKLHGPALAIGALRDALKEFLKTDGECEFASS